MSPILRSALSLTFALGAVGSSTRNCIVNTGRADAGCNCTDVGEAATCVTQKCHCSSGGCAGSDGQCYDQTNTQVGGTGQVYRIRNARWPKWYLELDKDSTQLMVRKGRKIAQAKTFQWNLMRLPTSDDQPPAHLMSTEFKRDWALNGGTRRVCSVLVNGTELELSNSSTTSDTLQLEEPGPDGYPVQGLGMNGEELEFTEENETVRAKEIAERSEDDPDGEWFEDGEEEELLQARPEAMVKREELSYRSRYGSYYSRSRYSSYSSYGGSYYSRSRYSSYSSYGSYGYSSYYSRSRTYYSSGYNNYGYNNYGYNNYGYNNYGYNNYGYNNYAGYNNYGYSAYSTYYDSGPRRRTYCRDVPVASAVSLVAGSTVPQDKLTMKITRAPVASGKSNGNVPLVMLSTKSDNTYFLWVPRYSSRVEVSVGNPGAGAYWFFDPPLPDAELAKLPDQTAACTSGCGSVGRIKDVGTVIVNRAAPAAPQLAMVLLGLAGVCWRAV